MASIPTNSLSPSWPQSHYDLIEHYYAQYDHQIATGEFQPFLYPWGTLGAVVVIAYLCVSHESRPWLRKCRYLFFAWMTVFSIYTVLFTRAKGMAASFGVGLVSAWGAIWVSAILVCNDAQQDFQRVERLEGLFKQCKAPEISESKGGPHVNSTTGLSGEIEQNGTTIRATNDITTGQRGPRHRHGKFAWQSYPLTPFVERLDWVCDLFCNFRGAGWSWRTSALPPLPKALQEQLHETSRASMPNSSNRIHPGQVKMYATRSELLRANIKTLVIGYVALDALKTCMMHDRYFWGLTSASPPDYFLFVSSFLLSSPVLTHIYRLTLCMFAIKYALETIFSLAPLTFSGLLGPNMLGARSEPWMYPETWASYSVVLDRGLGGWWSSWWHQTFRFAFDQPSRYLIKRWGWEQRSMRAKAFQLGVAFGLSGILHASGSMTCAGPTRPLHGPMAFFALQAFGIIGEAGITQALKARNIGERVPMRIRRALTFVYVHVWFYHTAHLLCDDFSSGGVWLLEPVPISLFRAIGLGVDPRDGWWCWSGQALRWHRGETWWTSGLAF